MYNNFKRYEKPINNLDIGKLNIIKSWLHEMNVVNYTINDDYTIDVKSDVNLTYKNLTKFPDFIKFNIIKGSFYCNHNKLKSLKGSPNIVNVSFFCNDNELTSLNYGPIIVNSSYIAHNNKIRNLNGIPQHLNTFSCNNNLLTNLQEVPKIIYGDLYCQDNYLNNLHNIPTNVKGNLYINFKNNEYSIDDIRKVCYVEGNIYV